MFSLLKNGFKKPTVSRQITIEELVQMIKNNENKGLIEELHTLVRGSEPYKKIKAKLPSIKPHATFNGYGSIECFNQFSGYLYFDIDNCDVEVTKQQILGKHRDKVCMMGKSVGGSGLFFYIKLSNPEVLSTDNFTQIQNYYINNIFQDLNIDKEAKGIGRNQIIPYDEDVYFNPDVTVTIPNDININTGYRSKKPVTNRKSTGRCIKKEEAGGIYTPIHFMDINEVIPLLKMETPVDTEGEECIIKPVMFVKCYIPDRIADGTKHKVFKSLVNVLVYLNPDVSVEVFKASISYINQTRTGVFKMKPLEMERLVDWAYEESHQTGLWDFKSVRLKRIHFSKDCGFSKARKTKKANELNGWIRKGISKLAIKIVVDWLREQGIKPTIKQVIDVLKIDKRLGETTIKRYWRSIVSKSDGTTPMEEVEELNKIERLLMQDRQALLNGPAKFVNEEQYIETYFIQYDEIIYQEKYFQIKYKVDEATAKAMYKQQFIDLELLLAA